jgi:uncharacterized protein (TIGR00730 family)
MKNNLQRITVFCGSSNGSDKIFINEAYTLGQFLANQNIELIYGGASIGVMGAVADGCLNQGGKVVGVIPKFLQTKEIAHSGLSELISVESMHQRKLTMHERADGFIVLAGGIGTMEEFFEILTWAQLGLHRKPIGILNTAGYYDDLMKFVQNMIDKDFLKPIHRELILVETDIKQLLHKMNTYQAPKLDQIISKEKI